MRYLKLLPVQLLICIALALVLTPFLTLTTVSFFYSISSLIKDVLMFVLPVVVFGYITAALLSVEQRAPLLLFSIFGLVSLSTAMAAMVSYGVSCAFLPSLILGTTLSGPANGITEVSTLFHLPIPVLMAPDRAMLLGVTVGLICVWWRHPGITTGILRLRDGINLFLRKGLTPALPVYVFGFVLKLNYEGVFGVLFKNYAQVLFLTCTLFVLHIGFLYYLGAGFKRKPFARSLENMTPAAITAFCTMSSAATMPVTLEETEKNLKNPNFAQLVIPTTVNIHLLGDALGLPLLGMAILLVNGQAIPSLVPYLVFVFYFCLAKYSTAGIPGGGVIVLLPVLEKYLGLTPEMLGLITTLYILQDCLFTSANVMGNGAFAMVVERILSPFMRMLPKPQIRPVTKEMVQENLRQIRKTG